MRCTRCVARGTGDFVVLETDRVGPQQLRHTASGGIDFRKRAYADALRCGQYSSAAATGPREVFPLQGRHEPAAILRGRVVVRGDLPGASNTQIGTFLHIQRVDTQN